MIVFHVNFPQCINVALAGLRKVRQCWRLRGDGEVIWVVLLLQLSDIVSICSYHLGFPIPLFLYWSVFPFAAQNLRDPWWAICTASLTITTENQPSGWERFRHSGQIIATSHDLGTKGSQGKDIPLFQGNPGWNMIIRPDHLQVPALNLWGCKFTIDPEKKHRPLTLRSAPGRRFRRFLGILMGDDMSSAGPRRHRDILGGKVFCGWCTKIELAGEKISVFETIYQSELSRQILEASAVKLVGYR